MAHHWPGNVRELERLIERTVALADADVIEIEDLPPAVCGDYGESLGPSLARNDSLRAWGSRYARLVVERADGNKRQACRMLGISYHTLQALLRFPVDEPCAPAQSACAAADEPKEVESLV